MEDTSCKENCCFVKSGFCSAETECPFFSSTWWECQEGMERKQKLVKDCFPKRMMIEQNKIIHRQLSEQSVTEELRNKVNNLESLLEHLLNQSKEFIDEKNNEFLLMQQNQIKLLNQG